MNSVEMKTEKTHFQQLREQEIALRTPEHNSTTTSIQAHETLPWSEVAEITGEKAADDAQIYTKIRPFNFSKDEGAAAFMRVLLREGKDILGKPSGGGTFSPPNPPEMISVPEQIFVYKDNDGHTEIVGDQRDEYGKNLSFILTERTLLDSRLITMPRLVDYAVQQGISVNAYYSERDRVNIVEKLCDMFEIVNCITTDLQVPWKAVEIKDVGLATLDTTHDPEFGLCFQLHVIAPKAKAKEVDAIFSKIEHELKYHSLHTGRALESAREGAGFMNPFVTNREDIIYPRDFEGIIERLVLGGIKNFDKNVREGKEKRLKKKILLSALFGRGKTMSLNYFMQIALKAKMTVIRMSPNDGDTLERVINKAKKYPRGAAIVVEDIDVIINQYNDVEKKKLQDLLDGQLTKGQRITIWATTNHDDVISQPFVRRFTKIVRLPALGREGTERMCKRIISNLDPTLTEEQWDQIYELSKEFTQSFLSDALDEASDLSDQDDKEFVEFDDLVVALRSKQDDYEIFLKAPKEGEEKTKADIADEYQREMVKQTIEVVLQDHYLESENNHEVFGIHSR